MDSKRMLFLVEDSMIPTMQGVIRKVNNYLELIASHVSYWQNSEPTHVGARLTYELFELSTRY